MVTRFVEEMLIVSGQKEGEEEEAEVILPRSPLRAYARRKEELEGG